MSRLNIAYMCDADFAALTMVSIHSLAARSRAPMTVTMFVAGEVPGIESWVARLVDAFDHLDLRLRDIDAPPAPDWYNGHLPTSSFLRLRLPEFFEERTLYLDGDTLLRADVAELFHHDLGGRTMGAVLDPGMLRAWNRVRRSWIPFTPKPSFLDRQVIALASRIDFSSYVNSGVLLLDLAPGPARDKLVALNDVEAAIAFRHESGAQHHDQDWINYRLGAEITHLPLAWNVFAALTEKQLRYLPRAVLRELKAAMAEPRLLHFTADSKPHRHATPNDKYLIRQGWHWWHEELEAITAIVGPGVKEALLGR